MSRTNATEGATRATRVVVARTYALGLRADEEDRVRTGYEGPRAFASQAGDCVRKVAYGIMDGWPQEDLLLTQDVAFRIGRDLEKAALAAIKEQDPDAVGNYPWVHYNPTKTGAITGRADAVYGLEPTVAVGFVNQDTEMRGLYELGQLRPTDRSTVVEIKSMAHSSFAASLKYGPKRQHVMQAAISAKVLGAGWVHLVYLSKNAPRGQEPIHEWLFPYAQVEHYAEIAEAELFLAVDAALQNKVPVPWFDGDVVAYPNPQYEPCMWCQHVTRCTLHGPQEVSLHELR